MARLRSTLVVKAVADLKKAEANVAVVVDAASPLVESEEAVEAEVADAVAEVEAAAAARSRSLPSPLPFQDLVADAVARVVDVAEVVVAVLAVAEAVPAAVALAARVR